ncbi:formate/nitrite transporter family protein [Leisingera aquaemixtae]|uniref:formate/nitrite transporter family protein n=1 Tax=Leisingera TaxID=191028 RepID=UPI001C95FBA8|nr:MULTISPECIES: formate/nitrite transporter family protein [Leisingera]MBY6069621.1 formate/nitrite transporter family protein [Leisingera aquaemixtae]MCB4458593.1 formate/nitrite transporter family protein [Leisingera sp. McT4-56]
MTSQAPFDAYKPAEIAALVESAGTAKARLPLPQMFVLAMLAGAFIGFGAAAYTMTLTGAAPVTGPVRVLGGAVFSLGLILVVIAGAELFTGNVLMVIAAVDRKIPLRLLLRSWGVVYAGNLAGAAGLAAAFALTGLLDGAMGDTAAALAGAKADLAPLQAFMRGALCNALVCLAVWLSFAARTAAGKVLAILWPITAFVLLGLEHSIANMYFFPQAWGAGAGIPLSAAAANLFWVTLGNIAGGAGGVALAYWFAFLGGRPQPVQGGCNQPSATGENP